jgi:hypothetical protein
MENLTINQGIKFTAGDGTGVIDTSNPSGSQGIAKTAGHTGFYIQSSVDYTLYFYDGSSWSAHQSIDVSDANYVGGFAFAWEDNTAAYIKTADSSHVVYVFGRNTDLKVDSTPGDDTQSADTIVDGSGSLSITAIDAQNDYTEGLTVANDGTVTFDRTDNNAAYQLKFSGNGITIGNSGDDTITLTGADEFTSPLTTDGDLFIQAGGSDSRLGIGSDNQILTVTSGVPSWEDAAVTFSSPLTTNGDLMIYNSGDVRLAAGSVDQVLTMNGGLPSWQDLPDNSVFTLDSTHNVYGGTDAGKSISSGQRNSLIGYMTGRNLSSGSYNTFIGERTVADGVVTGNANVAVGSVVMKTLSSGANNVGVGNEAGKGITTQSNNTLIGFHAGDSLTGSNNVAITNSYGGSKMADRNVVVGEGSLANTIGSYNVILGKAHSSVSNGNVMIGYNIQKNGTLTGDDNIFIQPNQSKSNNYNAVSGDHNIAIGVNSNIPTGKSNYISIDDYITIDQDAGLGGINVGGTGTMEAMWHIKGDGATSATSSLKVVNSSNSIAVEVLDDLVVVMPNLPTSSAGLPSGALWNDSGTVKVA